MCWRITFFKEYIYIYKFYKWFYPDFIISNPKYKILNYLFT